MANGMNVPCQESGKKLKENCNSEGKPWVSSSQTLVCKAVLCGAYFKMQISWKNPHGVA